MEFDQLVSHLSLEQQQLFIQLHGGYIVMLVTPYRWPRTRLPYLHRIYCGHNSVEREREYSAGRNIERVLLGVQKRDIRVACARVFRVV